MSHPPAERLVSQALSPAPRPPRPGSAAERAARHLAEGCPECTALARAARAALAALEAGPFPEVPPRLRARAVTATEGRKPGVLALVGRLVHDSFATPAPALALRGEGVAERHVLYRSGGYDVDVALLEDGTVVGQVLAPEGAPPLAGGVCQLSGGDRLLLSPLLENGDFRFAGAGPGVYALLVDAPPAELGIERLDLGPGGD